MASRARWGKANCKHKKEKEGAKIINLLRLLWCDHYL